VKKKQMLVILYSLQAAIFLPLGCHLIAMAYAHSANLRGDTLVRTYGIAHKALNKSNKIYICSLKPIYS
jgi:hypothetical protein